MRSPTTIPTRPLSSLPFSGSTSSATAATTPPPSTRRSSRRPRGYFVVGYAAGVPVACGGWRARDPVAGRRRPTAPAEPAGALRDGDAEIKRMFVRQPTAVAARAGRARRAGALRRRGRTAARGAGDRHAPTRGDRSLHERGLRADGRRSGSTATRRTAGASRRHYHLVDNKLDQRWRDRRDGRKDAFAGDEAAEGGQHGHAGSGADRPETRRERDRLRLGRVLFRSRTGYRARRPALDLLQPRLPALRPVAAGVGDRAGVHLGQPRGHRAHRDDGERGPVRHPDRALLLDRRRPRDGVPGHRDDAVLLRQQGPQRPGVPGDPVQPDHPAGAGRGLRAGLAADRGGQPVRAGPGARGAARLARSRSRSRWPHWWFSATRSSAGCRRRSTTRCCSSS